MINTLIAYRIIKNDPSLCKLKENMQLYICGLRSADGIRIRLLRLWQLFWPICWQVPEGCQERRCLWAVRIINELWNFLIMPGWQQATVCLFQNGKEPLLYSVYSMKRVMNARQSDAFKVEVTLEKTLWWRVYLLHWQLPCRWNRRVRNMWCSKFLFRQVVVMPQNLLISPVLKYIVSILKRKLLSLAKITGRYLSVYGSFASTLYWKIYAEPCESGTDVFPGGECK